MSLPMLFVLVVLASFRLTKLAWNDEFPPVARLRLWLDGGGDPETSARAYLFTCPHCLSVWASAVVTAITWAFVRNTSPGMPLPILWWAAVAGACSFVYWLLPEDEEHTAPGA